MPIDIRTLLHNSSRKFAASTRSMFVPERDDGACRSQREPVLFGLLLEHACRSIMPCQRPERLCLAPVASLAIEFSAPHIYVSFFANSFALTPCVSDPNRWCGGG